MKIAKAVILADGVGHDRPWPAASSGSRHLFPVANRPIVFHALESLHRAGLLEATIVADVDTREAIRRAVGDGRRWKLSVRYEQCREEAGLPGALAACRAFIGEEPVLVQQADALLRGHLNPYITTFSDERLDAMALRVVPGQTAQPADDLPSSYLLSPRALALLMQSPDAAADPIDGVRGSGGRVRVQSVDGCLPCHGDLDALLECNRRMLEQLEGDACGALLEDSEIQGHVIVHPSAEVRRSTLRGPLIIGPGARLTDAYVGPYSSIGANVVIEGAEVEHSILLPGAQLAFVGTRIESSVIGEGARVSRAFRKPSSLRMSIGNGAEVLLS
jgi:glucose-1-phosphate thymidylyltransferase